MRAYVILSVRACVCACVCTFALLVPLAFTAAAVELSVLRCTYVSYALLCIYVFDCMRETNVI